MNELTIITSTRFGEVRMIEDDGKVLFVAADVARALGYKNTSEAIKYHCRGIAKRYITDDLGRQQEVNAIPEGDIYRLAAKSELDGAEEFESWIFDDVIPSVRKHGAYATPETIEKMIMSPEFGIKLLTALKDEQDKSKALQITNARLAVENEVQRPKAEYFDELVDRNLLTNFRDTAKEIGIRERDFITALVERKYIYRTRDGKLMPYADRNDGLFEVKECFNDKTNWRGVQTLVTPKGREKFLRML